MKTVKHKQNIMIHENQNNQKSNNSIINMEFGYETIDKGVSYKCNLCQYETNSKYNYNKHKKTDKHKKLMKNMEKQHNKKPNVSVISYLVKEVILVDIKKIL